MSFVSPRRALASRLERGVAGGSVLAGLERAWVACARVERDVGPGVAARVIGVGGATLGGAGKTPLARAIAAELAARGVRVAVAARACGVGRRSARVVRPGDTWREVGDEPLALARALASAGVPVVAGTDRAATLGVAAARAEVVVADGLLQARPARVAASLLVVDAGAPWGSGRCPPLGDLRASPRALTSACDAVVRVVPTRGSAPEPLALGAWGGGARPVFDVGRPPARSARRLAPGPEGEVVTLERLGALRVGVVLALARPERLLSALAVAGLRPVRVVLFGDHEAPRLPRAACVDAWLTTPKCATKLEGVPRSERIWVLEDTLGVPRELVEFVAARLAVAASSPAAPGG
ncbi:MAG: tetraacyldisaccharide 4'-kinase [Polyangiaceae bacterium]|nr:tetraacyldisaccharide 4'-kinase [Polyangiaceae bacterium]